MNTSIINEPQLLVTVSDPTMLTKLKNAIKMMNGVSSKRFDKALKLCKKRGYPIEELRKAIAILVENGSLPSEYKPHILHGNHEGEWEAHIKPDWLLVWEQNDDELTLLMLTTGTHSDVFGKTRRIRNLMASNQGCHFQKNLADGYV